MTPERRTTVKTAGLCPAHLRERRSIVCVLNVPYNMTSTPFSQIPPVSGVTAHWWDSDSVYKGGSCCVPSVVLCGL